MRTRKNAKMKHQANTRSTKKSNRRGTRSVSQGRRSQSGHGQSGSNEEISNA
jgi:hypothetical protein